MGLVGAVKGEERINWALLRIIDVLMRLSKDKENNSIKLSEEPAVNPSKMGTSWNRLWFGGSHNRYEEFTRLLNDLASDLKPLIIQPEPGKPKLTGIKLYVYGFPRGARGSWLLPRRRRGENRRSACRQAGCSCPSAWSFSGCWIRWPPSGGACGAGCRRAYVWADGTMELPDDETYGGLIKMCPRSPGMSSVSAFRWTQCAGQTANTRPVPLGWFTRDALGYWWRISTGDQGKANGENDSLLLSQVVLNDLYSASFGWGPLKVPVDTLPVDLKRCMACYAP